LLACLQVEKQNGFLGGPTYFQPIRAFSKASSIVLIGRLKASLQKGYFFVDI